MLSLSSTSSYAVFVYLCILYLYFFVFARLTHVNIICDTSEQSSFQKYTTYWVFLALCNMLYLCICIFVFVYLSMRHLVISVLISWDQELSEDIWFVWPKTSYSGDVTDTVRTDKGREGYLAFDLVNADLAILTCK